ncbi:hypothetical protein [Frigoribacterium salinisoli]
MQPRFRLDGVDLGLDLRACLVTLTADGVLDAVVVAGTRPADGGPPPVLRCRALPVGFDGTSLGAELDDDVAVLHDVGLDLGDADEPLAELTADLTISAGDHLRVTGTVRLPDGRDAPLDVALAFGAPRRRPAV